MLLHVPFHGLWNALNIPAGPQTVMKRDYAQTFSLHSNTVEYLHCGLKTRKTFSFPASCVGAASAVAENNTNTIMKSILLCFFLKGKR